MKAKKSLGQHFLTSSSALSAMVGAADVHSDDVVLEIGPGKGVLTERLVRLAGKVIAVEKDPELVTLLTEKFAEEIKTGRLELLEKDILEFDPGVLAFYAHPYKLVANIPYYITGQILRMFLEAANQPESMTLLVQKEVAERIVARDQKESLLSLSVKAYGTPKIIKTVPRGSFAPAPTVDSAIVHIAGISRNLFQNKKTEKNIEKTFFEILHAGFAHKRKQLFSNLFQSDLGYDKSALSSAFVDLQIDPKARAEDISLDQWIALAIDLL